jgi:uncharacterized protein YecT (DUF1311 family)
MASASEVPTDGPPVAAVQPAVAPAPETVAQAAPDDVPPPVSHCAAAPTLADRAICQSPHLQRLQRELRRAYAEAMMVHQDRALLRSRQLAWREARNDVAAPGRLAQIYEDRIRRLQAATADARRQR